MKQIRLRSRQTVTDYGVTALVDLILGDSNTTEHLRGSGAQIEVVRVDADSNSMANLTMASPHADTDGLVSTSGSTASIDWEWQDPSGDVYTAQSGKVYSATPAAGQDLFSASTFQLEAGETERQKAAEKVAKFQWDLTLSHATANAPSALQAEIAAGLEYLANAIVDSSASHVETSTLYAFLNTTESQVPLRESDPIHDGTSGWTVTAALSRNRTNTPHRFTINVSFDGPSSTTEATGVYVGVGSITDDPRKIIYGEQTSLSFQGQFNASYIFEFADA